MAAQKQNSKQTSSKKKKGAEGKFMKIGGAIFGLLFLFVVWAAFQPTQGSIQYAICRAFIEMDESYPQELRVLGAEDNVNIYGEPRVIIYYRNTDTFGEKKSNTIVCQFDTDENGNILTTLKSVDINRKRPYDAEKPEYIKRFNVGIPTLLEYGIDNDIPYYDLDDIKTYRDIE